MRRLLAITCLLFCLPLLAASVAHADQDGGGASRFIRTKRVVAPMEFDCSSLTAEGKKYARKNNICGYRSPGVVAPKGISRGNCGISYVDITGVRYDDVSLSFGATSSWGWILQYRLDAWYEGHSRSGDIVRTGYSATSSISFRTTVNNVGYGFFETRLTGWAVTPLGRCVIVGARDFTYI